VSQVLSFHDWFRFGKFAARPRAHAHRTVVPEPFRNIEAGPVHMINVLSPAGAVVDRAVPEYVVHLVLSTPPLLQVGFNRRLQWLVMSPGVILVTPPDTDCDFVSDGASHVLAIGIPKAHVEDFTQDSGTRVEVRREETFRDPRLARQLVRLWHTLSDDEPAGRLLADHVVRGALDTLARRTDAHAYAHARHAPDARSARHFRERLPGHTIRRLRDYVESSLADDLDVTMMANVAALSPAHFARAFAATVGMTPFEYVMTRRLARAHELLERTDRSALDIALTVGFKTPSHFASRFRREFGVTPREIRPDSRRPDERLERVDLDLVLDPQEPYGVVVEDVTLV
jgi:AraC family transcriptional regulator